MCLPKTKTHKIQWKSTELKERKCERDPKQEYVCVFIIQTHGLNLIQVLDDIDIDIL